MEPRDITFASAENNRSMLTEVGSHRVSAVCESKPFSLARLQFAFVSIFLMTCAGPAGAQTLHSPNNMTGRVNSTHSGGGAFGGVNDSVSGLVDASVQGYSGAVSEYTSIVAGTGSSGKGSASLARVQSAGSAAAVLSREMQGTKSPDINGLGGAAQKSAAITDLHSAALHSYSAARSAVLHGAARPQPGARSAVPTWMRREDTSNVQGQEAPSKDADSADLHEQGAASNDVGATESGANAFETSAFPEDQEGINDPFQKLLGTSFEELCTQNCGSLSNSSGAGGGPTTANGERVKRGRLSSSATRLRAANMAAEGEGQKIQGRLDASHGRFEGSISAQGKRSVHRGLSGHR
jgi:hypothetical protein